MEELIEKRYQILQKTSQQRERIGGRKLPKIKEPVRECTHWDYFLEEMKWLANDFIEDRKHKQALSYVIVNEISHKKTVLEKSESKKESASRDQAKKISDLVMKYFYLIDDSKKAKVPQKITEKNWKVLEISTAPQVNIILENSRNKLGAKIDESKEVYKYSLGILNSYGYTYSDKIEELLNQEPSTPETTAVGEDLDGFEAISNFQLFYDAEVGEKDFNLQLEELHLEDLDVYRPLINDTIEFRDITYEETMIEEELFELVPDSEEYMLWESTKKVIEAKEDFSQKPEPVVDKTNWKIFEDMILEQTVCEFGGHWEFISDLLSSHNLTTFNYVTPEECFNRWATLQMRKGRVVSHNFRPAQVFQNQYPPVQGIQSRFSLNKRRQSNVYIYPRITPAVPLENPSSSFDFYLSHNIRPEGNSYFSNYKNVNSRYYAGQSGEQVPKVIKKEIFITEKQIIDKEEENSASILEIIDSNKPEPQSKIASTGSNPAKRNKNNIL